MDDSRIKDVSSLLRAFFDDEQIRKGGQYAKFFAGWKAIVGERAAGHSRISEVDRSNLVIEVDHPGWIQLLQLRQSEILRSVRERFPELELRGIVFRLGKLEGLPDGIKSAPPGPFGPEGRELAPHEEDAASRPGRSSGAGNGSRNEGGRGDSERRGAEKGPLSLEAIEDPVLKARLAELKKAMDEGRKSE